MDLLNLATIDISIARGQPATAAFITWLLALDDLLQQTTADRARSEITKLVKLDASEAFRIEIRDDDKRVIKIDPRKIRPGDKLMVSASRRVAADGMVISGHTLIDKKTLTNKSEPREHVPNNHIL